MSRHIKMGIALNVIPRMKGEFTVIIGVILEIGSGSSTQLVVRTTIEQVRSSSVIAIENPLSFYGRHGGRPLH